MRKTLVLLVTILSFTQLFAQKSDKEIESNAKRTGVFYVQDFGAKGDGKTDDTRAIQSALNQAGKLGGAIVDLGIGNYLCKGHLNIPENVTLRGIWETPTARTQLKGSTLLVTEGKDMPNINPFIMMHQNSTLKGLTIFYPEQDPDNIHPYPWTVQGEGDNISILDILMVNPFQAVDFGTHNCGRHYIRGLYAQALYRGIFVDKCFDIGRIENVHFWPFWMDDKRLHDFTSKSGEAFIFGRTDWEYVSNCFAIMYNVGYHFISNKEFGPGNVVLTQSGSDEGPCAVRVEDSQAHAGISFSNSQFMAGVVVDSTNHGPVKFTSCGFWGIPNTTQEQAKLQGTGNITFNGCHFVRWDTKNEGKFAIFADCQNLTVTACEFQDLNKKHVLLTPAVHSAIITSNQFHGQYVIDDRSEGELQIGDNTIK